MCTRLVILSCTLTLKGFTYKYKIGCIYIHTAENKSDISYLKTSRAFDVLIHSSQTLLVSNSVGTTSSRSLQAFPLSVSLASSRLHCLCFSVSISKSWLWQTTHCSYTTEQQSKLPKSAEVRSHGNNVRDVIIAHVISADAQIYIPTDAETAK